MSTLAQANRAERAAEQMTGWAFEDASDTYRELAARITTPGGTYLTFPNQCTCRDWEKRGPVLGTGEIELCKHQIGLRIWNGRRNASLPVIEKPKPVDHSHLWD